MGNYHRNGLTLVPFRFSKRKVRKDEKEYEKQIKSVVEQYLRPEVKPAVH